jgi:prevent-host-death family protein
MATRLGIRELRDTLTQAIRLVEAGERLEITRDGVPVAVIAPYEDDPLDRLVSSGRATPGRPFRPPSRFAENRGPKTASEILLEGREDRF